MKVLGQTWGDPPVPGPIPGSGSLQLKEEPASPSEAQRHSWSLSWAQQRSGTAPPPEEPRQELLQRPGEQTARKYQEGFSFLTRQTGATGHQPGGGGALKTVVADAGWM